jgi:hypothetical protein
VTTIVDATVPEKILLAAYHLEEQGQSPFSAEALIVASWQKYPRTFGLKGYADNYPDSNKVLSSIMGEKGLARRGWLAKMGQKMYSLTRDGKQVVRRLLQAGESESHVEPAAKLTRDQEKFFIQLSATPAVEKYHQGLKLELTFADACKFWGINENMHGDALDARLHKLRSSIAELDLAVGRHGIDLSNGRSVSSDDIALLQQVDEYLKERFGRHLTLLRNRVGRS